MISTLPPRDRDVATLLLKGYANKEIASELGMALRTVKAHCARMFQRFHIESGYKRNKLALLLAEPSGGGGHINGIAFTPKERKVLDLVVSGLKNHEVATEIGTTENMVKHYLVNIFDKTGMSTRLELTLWYLAHTEPSWDI